MKTKYGMSDAVQPSAIEMMPPVFVCGGGCLSGDCNSRQCLDPGILIYDISSDDGGTCFVGLRKGAKP